VLAGGQHIVEQHDACTRRFETEHFPVEPDDAIERVGRQSPGPGMVRRRALGLIQQATKIQVIVVKSGRQNALQAIVIVGIARRPGRRYRNPGGGLD